ncbi:hypothetical protein CNY89_03170 [Amaricoccus sp. HAR-UPW-R2A-40]|nr:hypothetical protein CNY89_03170 [Amaricoccus sp. HAR-UPW-R2A-40]
MALRARSKLACKIADIDPLRLNEAVFAKHYNCAPETRAGSPRIFDEDGIVALRIFGDKTRIGWSTANAGELACSVLAEIQRNPEAEWVTIIWDIAGRRAMTSEKFLKEEESLTPIDPGWKLYQDCINVKAIRSYVRECLEEERTILGAE